MFKKKKKYESTTLPIGWNVSFNLVVGLFCFLCVFPFIFVVIISLTDDASIVEKGYSLFPSKISLDAYKYVFKTGTQLLQSYVVTIMVTAIGTIVTIMVTALYSYALSRKEFKYRKFFAFFCFFTMLFNGGLVPTYMVVSQMLHLKNTIWALIMPMVVNAWYIIVLRTYFTMSISDSLIEAAKIDGAGDFYILFRIVMPISLPGLATIGLFSSLGYWNDWFQALLYITKPSLYPLQYLLVQIENNITFLLNNASNIVGGESYKIIQTIPQYSLRMAMVIVCIGPIICAYPFFQRYFIKGLTVGSVKG